MIGTFALSLRKQVSAVAADTSAPIVSYDLYFSFPDEKQARHLALAGNPIDTNRTVGELGQPVSKDKLAFAATGPQVIQPGAVGSQAHGQSLASQHTATHVEMLDAGEVEIVSDQNNSKIFKFAGKKLIGRMILTRNAQTSKFDISIEKPEDATANPASANTTTVASAGSQVATTDAGAITASTSEPVVAAVVNSAVDPLAGDQSQENDAGDPVPLVIEDFISQEFDEVITDILSKDNLSDDVRQRMSAIRQRLADKTIDDRDVVFVLKFISGGDASAMASLDTNQSIMLCLWDSSESKNPIVYLDAETGDEYKVVPEAGGTYGIPRFQFISEGVYNDENFDGNRIDQLVSNFAALSKTKILDAPVKIGHHKKQSLLGNIGELAHGWIDNLWSEDTKNGKQGFVSITGMPQTLAYLVSKRALKNRSAEIFKNVKYNGKDYGSTLKAISFLGASTPAVLGMQGAGSQSDPAVQMYEQNGSTVIIVKPKGSTSVAEPVLDKGSVLTLSKAELDAQINTAVQGAVEKMKAIQDADAKLMTGKVTELSLALANERDARRKDLVKANKSTNAIEFDSLVKGGHVLPVQKDAVLQFCAILDGIADMAKGRDLSDMFDGVKANKDTLEFSVATIENDKPTEITAAAKALFFRLLRNQKQIDLSIQTKDGKDSIKIPDTKSKVSVSDEITELTKKIQKDEKIPYAEAFSKAYAQKFGDETPDAVIEGRTSTPISSAA